MAAKKRPRVVVMGGGTGTFWVTTALKQLPVSITTVIAVSDSGGSTGRIRDEFGFQPVGDLRQALAALANPGGQEWIKKILLYRFSKGNGLKGHNLGNLILTALQDMTGSTGQALAIAEKVFNLQGEVVPVTEQNVNLKISFTDGTTVIGEHTLDEHSKAVKTIDHISLVPKCVASQAAVDALRSAKLIIIGPGDYYASLLATLVVPGIPEALTQTRAKIIYITNLMTRRTQTHKMTASDHLEGIEKTIGRKVQFVVVNSAPIPPAIKKAYASEEEYPIVDDLPNSKRIIRAPLVYESPVQKVAADTAYRSLLRHDQKKLQTVIKSLLP